MMNAFPPKTEFPLDPAGAEDVLTAPTSFGPSFPSEFPFEDEPHKGKKKGKKGKKARKKAAKRARKRATERRERHAAQDDRLVRGCQAWLV